VAAEIDVVRRIGDLRARVAAWRAAGERVALVPTMGALHAGHLDLVRAGKARAQRAVVSIFVNPKQFAPHEDFGRYPRDEAGDLAKLAGVGADLVWAPEATEMYPEGFATRIEPAGAAAGLETDFRPHFFGGVTTVCCKLFSAATPDFATFGEKDYQQLCVIRQMVRDLNLPLEILGVPTAREPDGLALSSRNQYLSARERQIAPLLNRVITDLAASASQASTLAALQHEATQNLMDAGFAKVDYVALRDAETLADWLPGRPGRVLVAAWLGKTRLIDNVAVPLPHPKLKGPDARPAPA
jgi:pantoate--beta-alanine ligase